MMLWGKNITSRTDGKDVLSNLTAREIGHIEPTNRKIEP